MKQRIILNDDDLKKAAQDLMALSGRTPFVITVTEGTKIRSTGQNSRYWCDIQYFMDELRGAIEQAEEQTGHTNIEIRHILAEQMPIEQAVILFARKPETVHEILKDICGIPTSTRLGTKAFMKFEDRLAQVMSEIIGTVRAILR
jgi:hypothetical protein